MSTITPFDSPTTMERADDPVAPYLTVYADSLTARGYAESTVRGYLAGVAHFAAWASQQRLRIEECGEEAVQRFLTERPPDGPGSHRGPGLEAALGHLLVVLRVHGALVEPRTATTPVDEELRRFDAHLERVRGLAPKTRGTYLGRVRLWLVEQFGAGPVNLAAVSLEAMRQFLARQGESSRTSANLTGWGSALRSYFRFRAASGDIVHGLLGTLCYPANWQLASLPQTLSPQEVECLIAALDSPGPSARRTKAIVRCALDLGLRRGEIAELGLDDIDWRAGTITLRRTKGRREDVLPLPAITGAAIADYLRFERPETPLRTVFVRRAAPRDQPLGRTAISEIIGRTYARAGLPHTRAHLLRHTLAGRLLEKGSSLKEVADVLRHRSLNTTLIYAKLDSRNLAAVALPWPGYAS